MRLAAVVLACALAGAGCRQLFGIDDTAVATDAPGPPGDARIDAPPGTPDAPIDAPPGTPDAPPPDAGLDAFICPAAYGPELIPGHRYRSIATSVPWATARTDCENDIPGHTYLAIPDDPTENQAIKMLVNNDGWIGVYDALGNDTWQTVLGATPTYFDWESGEPDLGSNDCVTIKDGAGNGSWSDTGCGNTRRFICECE